MAFPVVQSRSSYDASVLTTHPVTLPSGIVAGDILVMACTSNGNVPPTGPPAGWAQEILNVGGGTGTDRFLAVFSKTADGSEGATVDVDMASGVSLNALVWRISGGALVEGTSTSSSGTTPNPPSLSPSWGARDTLWIALFAAREGSASAYPAGYSNGRYSNHSTTFVVGGAEKSSNAASEDPGTFTIPSSAVWVGGTVAIQPDGPGFFPFFS